MTPQLPHARTWYVLGTLLALAVIVASLLPLRAVTHMGMNDKLQHALAYTALALWFGGLVEPRRYWRLVLALIGMGVAIEIVQGAMGLGRQADAADVAANAGGIAVGMALCLAGLRHWARWLEQWLSRV